MSQEIYKKQFSIGKILSESWNRFTENFQLILLITLIVYLPINLVLELIPVSGSLDSFNLYFRIVQILETFIGIIATIAIAYVIKNKIDGKSINIYTAFKKAFSKWGAAIVTSIILGLLLFLLTLLLIIPGIIFYVYWIFVIYVVIFNDKSGKDALNYSKKIVKGRWWTVAGYSIVFGIIGFFVALIGGIPYWFLPEYFLTTIATNTLIDILMSFFTVVLTIFYINFDSTKKTDVKNSK